MKILTKKISEQIMRLFLLLRALNLQQMHGFTFETFVDGLIGDAPRRFMQRSTTFFFIDLFREITGNQSEVLYGKIGRYNDCANEKAFFSILKQNR